MLVRGFVNVVLLIAPATLAAQGFEYAPGTTQYRISQKSTMTQELMGQKNSGELTNSQVVTVSLSRAARDTVTAVLVLDSISASNTIGAPMPSLAELIGMKVTARLSPSGQKVYSVVGPTEQQVPNSSEIAQAMGEFLPKIRVRLAKGAVWADTAVGKVKQFGLDLDRRVISRYTVVGDTTLAGESAWKVARTDSASVSGSGVGQGGAMTMEGASAGRGQFYMTAKGAFAGGEHAEDGNVRIVVSGSGAELSITTTSTTKIQRVK